VVLNQSSKKTAVRQATRWLLAGLLTLGGLTLPVTTVWSQDDVPQAPACSTLNNLVSLKQDRALAIESIAGGLRLRLGSQHLGDYIYQDSNTLRPYFCNMKTPSGLSVTRNHPPSEGRDSTDHATMHPGIWLAFGDINGEDFWRNKAQIKHSQFIERPAVDDGVLQWIDESVLIAQDQKQLGKLRNQISVRLTEAGVLIDWQATLSAGTSPLILGDQEEMGLGVRVSSVITEKNGGLIINSNGLKSAKATWGQPAQWCDYSGQDSGRSVGITLLASTDSVGPCWWHNRDYGLIVANPFGRAAMQQGAKQQFVIEPNQSLQLRFRALLHDKADYDPHKALEKLPRQK
jgi:Methane oxygenase PmoA